MHGDGVDPISVEARHAVDVMGGVSVGGVSGDEERTRSQTRRLQMVFRAGSSALGLRKSTASGSVVAVDIVSTFPPARRSPSIDDTK